MSDEESEEGKSRTDSVFESASQSAEPTGWDGINDDPSDNAESSSNTNESGLDTDQNSRNGRTDDEPSGVSGSSVSGSQEGDSGQKHDLPHRVKHDSPKDARENLTFYVGDEDMKRIRELDSLANSHFDQKVYITDVYLAALRAGLQSDDSFIREMERIGYGYFD